ncbi:MAG: PRC-barrel domain-containing protein [Pseudomonadota bacterium]
MTRTLTSTVAVLALSTTAAFAEMHASDNRSEMHNNTAMSAMSSEELAQAEGKLIRSRDITGGQIYTMNAANDEGWNPEMSYDEVGSEWNQIGEIEDLVLTSDGKVTGIVAEVGGFLDIGDKHVVISVSDLNLVAVDDQTYAYVTKFSEEQLEEMDAVDEGFWN